MPNITMLDIEQLRKTKLDPTSTSVWSTARLIPASTR